MKKINLFYTSLTCILLLSARAEGDFLRDLGRVVVAPSTIPLDLGRRIIQRDDPKQAIIGPLQSAGRVIQQGSTVYQRAQDVFYRVPRDAIARNLGGDWVNAYDTLTASERIKYEMASTSGRYLGKCLQGQPCGVNELAAGPLAAAMRDAYKIYYGHASPLDPRVAQVLSRVVPLPVLQSARWVVGATPNFTIPGFLNAAHEARGQGFAVTLANLIVFSRPLNFNDLNDWNWLLHELRHVEQYMSYSNDTLESIDGFAVNYMNHYSGVEADAQNTADQRQSTLNSMCQSGGC